MYKNLFLILVYFALLPTALAQNGNAYTDSLEAVLQKPLQDSGRAKTLFLLAKYWSDFDTTKALGFARQALKFNPGDPYHQAEGHFYFGYIYLNYDVPNAQKEFMLAEKLLRPIQTREAWLLQSRLWNNYAIGYQIKGDEKAFVNILLNKVIPFTQKAGDPAKLGLDYLNPATSFNNVLDYDKAIEYYKKGLLLLKQKDPYNEDQIDCYSNIAGAYLFKHNTSAAKPYIDSAHALLNRYPDSRLAPLYYRIAGTYYNRMADTPNALLNLNRGLNIAEKQHQQYAVIQLLFELCQTYRAQKQYTALKQTLLKIYNNAFAMESPENKRMVLMELAKTDSTLNNRLTAYNWLMQFITLTDSVFDAKTRVEVSALETRFKTSEKEKQILSLQNEKKQQQLNAQKNKALTIILIIALAAAAALLFVGWRLYHHRQKIAQQQSLLHEQQLKEIQQASQLKVYDALIQGQEQERHRVARDLHDGLGGLLAGVKLKLSAIAANQHLKRTDVELYKVIHQLDGSVNELRRIAKNMMPETLLELGLEAALRSLCESLATEQLKIDFEAIGLQKDIPQTTQITLYRIIQELLGNAIKHAQANNILVQCSQNRQQLLITVEDDGRGFDMENRPEQTGIGLSNIKSRVEYLNGKFDIESASGKGTTVNIEVTIDE